MCGKSRHTHRGKVIGVERRFDFLGYSHNRNRCQIA